MLRVRAAIGASLFRGFSSQRGELPARVVEIARECTEHFREGPPGLKSALTHLGLWPRASLIKKENRFQVRRLAQELHKMTSRYPEGMKVLSGVRWVHGTSSAALPLIARTGNLCLPTGELLDRGMAPMSGELRRGGMRVNGVSQRWISVETVRNLARSWRYATDVSHSFDPKEFGEVEVFFTSHLKTFQNVSLYDAKWDASMIALLQFKQWEPQQFEALQQKYRAEIDAVVQAAPEKMFYEEKMILRAIELPKEQLQDPAVQKKLEQAFCFSVNGRQLSVLIDAPYGSVWKLWLHENPLQSLWERTYTDHEFIEQSKWENSVREVLQARLFYDEHRKRLSQRDSQSALYAQVGAMDATSFLEKAVKERVHNRMQAKSEQMFSRLGRLKNVFKGAVSEMTSEEKACIISPFPILMASTTSPAFFLNGESEANIPAAKWGKEIDMVFVRKENMVRMNQWIAAQGLSVAVHDAAMIEPLLDVPLYHAKGDVIGEDPKLLQGDYAFIHKHLPPQGSATALLTATLVEMYLQAGHDRLSMEPRQLPLAACEPKSLPPLDQKIVAGARDPATLAAHKDDLPSPLIDLFIDEAEKLHALLSLPDVKKIFESSKDPLAFLVQVVELAKCFPLIRANTLGLLRHLQAEAPYQLTPAVAAAINTHPKSKG